jgi:hypothetical protein
MTTKNEGVICNDAIWLDEDDAVAVSAANHPAAAQTPAADLLQRAAVRTADVTEGAVARQDGAVALQRTTSKRSEVRKGMQQVRWLNPVMSQMPLS